MKDPVMEQPRTPPPEPDPIADSAGEAQSFESPPRPPASVRAAVVLVLIVAGMYGFGGALSLAFANLFSAAVLLGVALVLWLLLARNLSAGSRIAQVAAIFVAVLLMLFAFVDPQEATFIPTFLLCWGLGVSIIVLVTAPRAAREWFGRR
jgi:peptidoglycan/LPS O-acetylase OafA/YrhL